MASGTKANLKDNTGVNSGASITWNSKNTWEGNGGTTSDEAILSKGYLDDGTTITEEQAVLLGRGKSISCDISIENIPYTSYRVYGLLASDAGDNYKSRNFQVNGIYVWGNGDRNAAALVYGNSDAAFAATGSHWVEVADTTRGNYWTYDILNAESSSLVVNGIDKYDDGRSSIAGIIIEQIPEPGTLGMVAAFGGAIFFIRRKLMM